MKKYMVTIDRPTLEMEVEAESPDEAVDKVLNFPSYVDDIADWTFEARELS